jgi:hypothetical protein
MIDSPAQVGVVAPNGTPGTFAYDRSLMDPAVEIEVLTDRDVDQEREELFSRAVEMRGLQVREVDDQMLLELSGIPDDITQRAKMRVAAMPLQGAGGLPPEITSGGVPGAPQGPPANGNGSQASLPPALAARMGGAHAPTQARPPSRSRGAELKPAPFGGAQ